LEKKEEKKEDQMEFSGIAVDKAQNIYFMGRKLNPVTETPSTKEEEQIFLYKLDTSEENQKKQLRRSLDFQECMIISTWIEKATYMPS